MTAPDEHYQSAVAKIAREKNGGAVTAELFWDITVALGQDLVKVDERGEKRHQATVEMMGKHVGEDDRRNVERAEQQNGQTLRDWLQGPGDSGHSR